MKNPVLLTQSAFTDYEQLCSLDVLGLADTHENEQLPVYEEFKEELERSPAGNRKICSFSHNLAPLEKAAAAKNFLSSEKVCKKIYQNIFKKKTSSPVKSPETWLSENIFQIYK